MRPDMHDVLMEAKADAPPGKLSVDDLVGAGKRRQRRRSAGWVTMAAAVAAAAIVIPQVVTRPNALPAAAPATANVEPAASYAFTAFTAGPLKVSTPFNWTPTKQTADITKVGKDDSVGWLTVYQRGANPLGDYAGFKMVDTDPVNGRHAFFIEKKFAKATVREFAWDFGGGTALVQLNPLELAEIRQLAEAFRPVPQPVRLGFKVGYMPVGYRLAGLGNEVVDPKKIVEENNYSITLKSAGGASIAVTVEFASGLGMSASGKTPTCSTFAGRIDCAVQSADGSYGLDVAGQGAVDKSELLKVLASMCYDRSSSYLVSEALPASALPER